MLSQYLSATRTSFSLKGFQKTHLWPLKNHRIYFCKDGKHNQPQSCPVSMNQLLIVYRRHILWTPSTYRSRVWEKKYLYYIQNTVTIWNFGLWMSSLLSWQSTQFECPKSLSWVKYFTPQEFLHSWCYMTCQVNRKNMIENYSHPQY